MDVSKIKIPEQVHINGVEFPLVLKPEIESTQDQAFEWLSNNQSTLRDLLLAHGAVLLRGFPILGAMDFERALEEANFHNMPYVGGAAPRQEVTQGRILTTNESPPSEPIPLHHEMAQVPNPPSYIFFYCDVPPTEGGSTVIMHSNYVYEQFASDSPEFCALLEEVGLRYIRVMPDQDDESSPIGRSWRSTFQTDSRDIAEEKMKEAGMEWEWRSNGDLYTKTGVVPAIRQDERTGMKTFFNSLVAAYTGWQDSRNEAKEAVCCGNNQPVDHIAVTSIASFMDREAVAFKWEKGDLLCIDNRLVLHAREPFKGPRRILASIATH